MYPGLLEETHSELDLGVNHWSKKAECAAYESTMQLKSDMEKQVTPP